MLLAARFIQSLLGSRWGRVCSYLSAAVQVIDLDRDGESFPQPLLAEVELRLSPGVRPACALAHAPDSSPSELRASRRVGAEKLNRACLRTLPQEATALEIVSNQLAAEPQRSWAEGDTVNVTLRLCDAWCAGFSLLYDVSSNTAFICLLLSSACAALIFPVFPCGARRGNTTALLSPGHSVRFVPRPPNCRAGRGSTCSEPSGIFVSVGAILTFTWLLSVLLLQVWIDEDGRAERALQVDASGKVQASFALRAARARRTGIKSREVRTRTCRHSILANMLLSAF